MCDDLLRADCPLDPRYGSEIEPNSVETVDVWASACVVSGIGLIAAVAIALVLVFGAIGLGIRMLCT